MNKFSNDVNGHHIQPGDLFVLVRKNVGKKYQFLKKELFTSLFGINMLLPTNRRRYIDINGVTRIVAFYDDQTYYFNKKISLWCKSYKTIGRATLIKPCQFGFVISKHNLRVSQWKVSIDEKIYSVSNKTLYIIKNENDLDVVFDLIKKQNK